MRLVPLLAVCMLVAIAGCKKTSTPAEEPAATAPAGKVQLPGSDGVDIVPASAVAIADQTVELGCGMCTYKLDAAKGCSLAAVVNGVPMMVAGSDVNAHEAGLCSASKQAVVSGEVKDGEFVASSVEIQ